MVIFHSYVSLSEGTVCIAKPMRSSTASPSNRSKPLIATGPLGHGNCQSRKVWSKRCPSASLGEAAHGTPRYQDWTYYNILNLLNFTLSYHVLSCPIMSYPEIWKYYLKIFQEFWRCLPCSSLLYFTIWIWVLWYNTIGHTVRHT